MHSVNILLALLLIGWMSLTIVAAKSLRYQAPDECKWYAVTAAGDREVAAAVATSDGGNGGSSSIADDQEVALVCKVKTVNSDIEKTNLSVIQPQYTVRLKLICGETIFIESSVPSGSFQTLIDLKELSIEYCKISELAAGAFKGLRQLRNLTFSTRNNDWAGMMLNVRPGVFSDDLHSLERFDFSSNNIRSLPDSTFCQLQNLQYLNVSRNKLSQLDGLGFGSNGGGGNEVESSARSRSDGSSGKCSIGTSLKILDLSDNSFDVLPQWVFSRLGRLEELYLQNNAISFLADHCLDNLSSLTVLNLAHNKLVNLPPELFTDARQVKEIHLQNNSINVLAPGLFGDLTKLLVLDLSENELTEEWVNSAAFVGLGRLLVLNLSFNNITKLDGYMFRDLYQLRVLRLESNGLQQIPEHAFTGLTQLTTLLLSNNKLRRIDGYSFDGVAASVNVIALDNNAVERIADGAFENATRLEDLHVNENQLTEVPSAALANAPNLKTLDLGGNRITDIHANSFPQLNQLVGLRLTENNLTLVPKGVFDRLPQLQIINLSNNKIGRIEPGTFDGNLKVVAIRIDGNYLTEVSSGLFSKLPNLVWLNISENFLQWFDYALIPTGLQWLDIHGNKIVELGNHFEIENQLHLSVFDARNNLLSEITGSSIPDNVQNLYLANNRIGKIQSYAFFKKPNLTRVDLSGNQLKTLTPHSLRISAVPPDRALPEFFVAGNPFQCDCTMQWLQTYSVEPERNRPILADLDHVKCDLLFNRRQPQNTMAVALKEATLDQFLCRYELECAKRSMCDCCDFEACDCKMVCPTNCTCYLSVSSAANIVSCTRAGYRVRIPEKIPMNVTQLYLDGNDFRTIPSHSLLGRRSLRVLFLNDSNIEVIQNRSFHGLKELELLRLEGNKIAALKGNEFDGLDKLKELYLHNNRLTTVQSNVFVNLYSLLTLHLHRNYLNKFSVWKLPSSLNALTLSDNAWSCECEFLQQFEDYLRYAKNYIVDLAELKCYNGTHDRYRIGTGIGEDNLRSFCLPSSSNINNNNNNNNNYNNNVPTNSTWSSNDNFVEGALNGGNSSVSAGSNNNNNNNNYKDGNKNDNDKITDFGKYAIPAAIVAFAVCLLFGLAVFVICLNKEKVRVWFYSKFGVRLFYRSNEIEMDDREKLFDAFVSYSAKDEVFVAEELAPILENGDPPYKLCLYYREFPIGGYMSDTITQAVESSRRTIMVLSENLIKSEWCRYEFKTAYHQVLRDDDRRKRLIIVLLGDVPIRDLDPVLRAYMKNNLYLQWGDKLFWQKLRFALPDVPNNQRYHHHHNQQQHQQNAKNNRNRSNRLNSHHLHQHNHHHHHHHHPNRPLPDSRNISGSSGHPNNNNGGSLRGVPPSSNAANTITMGNVTPPNNSRSMAMHI